MRIGILVGKLEDGTLEYLGKPGDVDALDKIQRALVNAKGVVEVGKKVKRYVKTWLADAALDPLKAKKC